MWECNFWETIAESDSMEKNLEHENYHLRRSFLINLKLSFHHKNSLVKLETVKSLKSYSIVSQAPIDVISMDTFSFSKQDSLKCSKNPIYHQRKVNAEWMNLEIMFTIIGNNSFSCMNKFSSFSPRSKANCSSSEDHRLWFSLFFLSHKTIPDVLKDFRYWMSDWFTMIRQEVWWHNSYPNLRSM